MNYFQRLRRRIAALLRLVLPLGMLGTAALAPGCSLVNDVSNAVTRDESAADKARRLILVAYDTHTAASNSVAGALETGAIDIDEAGSLLKMLVEAKSALDHARMLVELSDMVRANSELERASSLIRLVLQLLNRGDA